MKLVAGINGFGRFGLHLLKYWINNSNKSSFNIGYINDEKFTIDKVIDIIKSDKKVSFKDFNIKKNKNKIIIQNKKTIYIEVEYSNNKGSNISWIGKPDLFFECSGKNTSKIKCKKFIKKNTKLVLISATSWDADKTLIYGFNHKNFNKNNRIISYGSCTVNAFVCIANFINNNFSIIDNDVNIIHNIPEYKLKNNFTLNRKFCTLEKSGPNLLKYLNKTNFNVNYTLVPYSGPSIIDFRFKIKKNITKSSFLKKIKKAIDQGVLKNLYNIVDNDNGPEEHNLSSYSAVIVKESIKVINNHIYFSCYFDNENSVNRYYDLAEFMSHKI